MISIKRTHNSPINERFDEIDGIRGWAAFFVVGFHLFSETLGSIFPIFRGSIFGFMFDGQLMVYIFFVLSGDALSISFFKENNSERVHRVLIVRYFRLTFPIVISCLAVYFLMKFDFVFNKEAGMLVGSNHWLGSFIGFKADLFECVKYSLSGVYFDRNTPTPYNPFLWTMAWEMLGSLIIFLNIFIYNSIKKNIYFIIFQVAFLLLFSPLLSLFAFGFLLGDLRSKGFFKAIHAYKYNYLVSWILFLLIVIFSCLRVSQFKILGHGANQLINFSGFHLMWAMAFLALIYSSNHASRFFKTRLSRYLGDISFPLYAIQFPVIISLTSFLIIHFSTRENPEFFYILGSILSLFTCIMLAHYFRSVEKKYLKLVNIGAGKILR